MLAAAVKIRRRYGEVPAARFWIALILTLYDTGLRIDAAMSLRQDRFDAAELALLAAEDTQKQGADQCVGVRRKTACALAAIRTADPRLFAWPFDQVAKGDRKSNWATLRRHFKKFILGPAGLPIDCDKPFQRFRRTSATQIKKAGGDATEQLGHSSPAVTDLYLDAEELGASRGCDRMPELEVPADDLQLRLFE